MRFPLTPPLSEERVNVRRALHKRTPQPGRESFVEFELTGDCYNDIGIIRGRALRTPSPGGEGRGEGEPTTSQVLKASPAISISSRFVKFRVRKSCKK